MQTINWNSGSSRMSFFYGEKNFFSKHWVKSALIRNFFWSVFFHIRTEYGEIRSQSECRKIRTRESSVFGHFLCSENVKNAETFSKTTHIREIQQVFRVLICSILSLWPMDRNDFSIRKNRNIFRSKTSPDQASDWSMDFIKIKRMEVTPITKTIGSFDLSLDKHRLYRFYIFVLILLIGLLTENNSSSTNASHSTQKIARQVFTIRQKGPKNVKTVEKVSINQLRKLETPVIYFLEFLFAHSN